MKMCPICTHELEQIKNLFEYGECHLLGYRCTNICEQGLSCIEEFILFLNIKKERR